MKKLFLVLGWLLLFQTVHAQTVDIPDANFLNAIIEEGVDVNGDGIIQVSEVTNISELDVSNHEITDITGINEFKNLVHFNCSQNSIDTIDLDLPLLETLDCNSNYNSLRVLKLESVPSLKKLNCYLSANFLRVLDLNFVPNLEHLDCGATLFDTMLIANIPKLKYLKIDRHWSNLTELDLSQFPELDTLICDKNELASLDLNSAPNLRYLDCSSNDISTLNIIDELPNLEYLNFNYNQVTDIDLKLTPNLKGLNFGGNGIDNIALQEVPNLEELNCSHSNISELNLSLVPNLKALTCGYLELEELDLSPVPNLEYLNSSDDSGLFIDLTQVPKLKTLIRTFNYGLEVDLSLVPLLEELQLQACNLEELDVSNLPNLKRLTVQWNDIPELDLSQNNHIEYLRCDNNELAMLDVSHLNNLEYLECSTNNLVDLLLPSTNFPLEYLNCSRNNLKDLILFTALELKELYCQENELEALDLSALTKLEMLEFGGATMQYVNMLNEHEVEELEVTGSMWNLKYLCADEGELSQFTTFDYGNSTIVNEYCPSSSFTLVDVVGSIFYGEDEKCEVKYPVKNNLPVEFFIDDENSFIHYSSTSDFKAGLPQDKNVRIGLFDLDSTLFSSSPLYYEINTAESLDSLTFCIIPNEELIYDECISMFTSEEPTAGFEHTYTIEYSNKGNTVSSGQIHFYYDSEIMELVQSEGDWLSEQDRLTLEFFELQPWEKRTTQLTFRVNSPMDDPPLNGGESLAVVCEIVTPNPDQFIENNKQLIHEIVVNSYDPNDKTCLNGSYVLKDSLGLPILFRIRFENLGTAPARNIVVRDTVDTSTFDLNSLRILSSSHSVTQQVVDDMIEFRFMDINLPFEDESNDGYVIFSLNAFEDSEVGDVLENQASIYFDFNWPIHTNIATIEVVEDADGDGFHNLEDCDDANTDINPNAEEVPNNDIDEDCDGEIFIIDNDMDGFNSDEDCDDTNANINPGADEIPNNEIDEDCDGEALFIDEDMDGFNSDEDCDDTNADINPNADEIPNNDIDENCDGEILIIDNDMDGFNSDEDCDDMNANINPGTDEIPNNEIDEDCDGEALFIDEDMDGFNTDEDCDDANADINPDAEEIPNNDVDEDCDGEALMIDEDMDGFNSDEDCDDMNADINPGADEIPNNGVDEDCDGEDLITSTKETLISKVLVYPNPASEILNIVLPDGMEIHLTIRDLQGRKALSVINGNKIDVSSFDNGLYLLEIQEVTTGNKILKKVFISN